MNIRILFFWIVYILIGQYGLAQDKGDNIFNPTILHELRITSNTEPNLYNVMVNEAPLPVYPYHLVNIEFDGEEIDSVGIRIKGASSTFGEHIPLKIDINEYISDLRFDGIKKINLSNSYEDETRLRDRLSYELFRRAGVVAPRSSYAEVYINDEFIDVYVVIQQIDDTYIKDHFSDKGSLAKYLADLDDPLVVKYGEDIFEEVDAEDNLDRLNKVDLRRFFKLMQINSILDAFDSYPTSNYYIYYSDKEDLYHYLPWDYNYILKFDDNLIFTLKPEGAIGQAIWDNPEKIDLYLEVFCELSNYLIDEAFIDELLESTYNVIQGNSQGVTVTHFANLKENLIERLQAHVDILTNEENYTCGDFSYPYEMGDLVINEFVAKSDSISGVQEPDGGTPDWIELYNNTEEDILLNHHYYLSNDIDFPKKWNFTEPVTIPANGYQIVWADRDVHQQGVHSNFKIKRKEGDLLLVHEDMTIIDQVSYEEQELNKGYARVPNGTGEFVIQDHTFNENNGLTSSTSSIDEVGSFLIYPNPASGFVNIINSEPIDKIMLLNSTGQLVKEINSNLNQLDLNGIAPGLYFIYIQMNDQLVKRKILKLD